LPKYRQGVFLHARICATLQHTKYDGKLQLKCGDPHSVRETTTYKPNSLTRSYIRY